jgi:hypothetical protein
MLTLPVVDLAVTLVDEVDTIGYHPKTDHALRSVYVLVLERCTHHGDELVVGLEAELGVLPQNFETLLELREQVTAHDLHFHVLGDFLVELVLPEEAVRAALEVLERVDAPLLYDVARNLAVRGQLAADLDDETLHHLHHEVGVLSWRDLVSLHEALNLLDSHRVKEHAHELQEQDSGTLDRVTTGG